MVVIRTHPLTLKADVILRSPQLIVLLPVVTALSWIWRTLTKVTVVFELPCGDHALGCTVDWDLLWSRSVHLKMRISHLARQAQSSWTHRRSTLWSLTTRRSPQSSGCHSRQWRRNRCQSLPRICNIIYSCKVHYFICIVPRQGHL